MPWDEACRKAETLTREHEGFYLSHKVLGRLIQLGCLPPRFAAVVDSLINYTLVYISDTESLRVFVYQCVYVSPATREPAVRVVGGARQRS